MSNSFISVFGSPGGVGLDPTFNVVTLNLVQGTSGGANSMSIGGAGGLNIIGPIISAMNNSTNGAASTPVVRLTGTTFTGGTTTTTKPTFLVEPTGTTSTGWATTGTLIGANAATGFTGRLIDCQLNGVSKFSVTSASILSLGNTAIISPESTNGIGFGVANNPTLAIYGGSSTGARQIRITGAVLFGWCPTTPDGTLDLILTRSANANLSMGEPLASGWLNQTISAAGGRIGTDTNNSPTNTFTIAGSISTGTGTGGNLRLGVYGTNGTSGTAIGTLNTVLTVVAARKVINIAGIPTSSAGLSSGDVYSNAGILTIVA